MKFEKTVELVVIYGDKFKVRVMTTDEQVEHEKKIAKTVDGSNKMFDAIFEALDLCGVPRETACKMEMAHLTQLVQFITIGKKN